MLPDAINSVLRQKYDLIEIIIVDDGSTDDIASVVFSYGDSRIRYVRQERGGRAVARNRCVVEAKGEYILWLDSDDALCADIIEEYLKVIQRYPEVCIVYGDLESTDVQFIPYQQERYRDWYKASDSLLTGMVFRNELPNGGTMVLKRAFDTIGPFQNGFLKAEDYEWFSRVPGRLEVKHVGRVVYRWRRHSGCAATGGGLEYDCRVVDGLVSVHPLHKLCPVPEWKRLPFNVMEALTAIKIAERYIILKSPKRALPWLRRAIEAKAGQEVTRLAIKLLESLSARKSKEDHKEC
jgi:glycosyltransferase involved in cell wall biosynthesis